MAMFNDTEYQFAQFTVCVMAARRSGEHLKELQECFAVPSFRPFLPRVLKQVANVLSLKNLKKCDQLVVVKCLQALFETFHNTPVTAAYFPFLVRFLLVRDPAYVVARLPRILTKLNEAILHDPGLLSVPEFPALLFHILDLRPGPSAFVSHFDGIIVKMSASLFYNTAPARECATLFFRKLFVPDEATVSFDGVFSSIASMYRGRDHSLRGYCALVESILKFVSANGAIIPEADLDLLAKIVRPLTVFNDERSRRVTELFAGEVDRFALGCPKAAVDHALALITEFTAPDLVRVRIAAVDPAVQ
jgi:hypothetical protein